MYQSRVWGFPRGKVNQGESEVDCAVREVYEEIGYDCSELIDEDRYVHLKLKKGKPVTLYIVAGVPSNTKFKPVARKEVSEVRWFKVEHIFKKAKAAGGKFDKNVDNFNHCVEFLKLLQAQLKEERAQSKAKAKGKAQSKAIGQNAKETATAHNRGQARLTNARIDVGSASAPDARVTPAVARLILQGSLPPPPGWDEARVRRAASADGWNDADAGRAPQPCIDPTDSEGEDELGDGWRRLTGFRFDTDAILDGLTDFSTTSVR
jgi:ADP-ribose pyrophosphatase YjhB (NUDIX family)